MKREVLWKGHAAYINGKMCSVKRISPFSWEVRIDNKTYNCHPTRSQARRWAEEEARGRPHEL